jgi:hypothetical protein
MHDTRRLRLKVRALREALPRDMIRLAHITNES